MSIRRLLHSDAPPAPPLKFVLLSSLGALIAIAITGGLSVLSGIPWLMAPFGASCVLAFGVPDSPLAQPRAIVGGHLVATAVGQLAGLRGRCCAGTGGHAGHPHRACASRR